MTEFPLQDPEIKCGLRLDLPKKERRHVWADMGLDVRNFGDKGFGDAVISACCRCGADKKVRAASLDFGCEEV